MHDWRGPQTLQADGDTPQAPPSLPVILALPSGPEQQLSETASFPRAPCFLPQRSRGASSVLGSVLGAGVGGPPVLRARSASRAALVCLPHLWRGPQPRRPAPPLLLPGTARRWACHPGALSGQAGQGLRGVGHTPCGPKSKPTWGVYSSICSSLGEGYAQPPTVPFNRSHCHCFQMGTFSLDPQVVDGELLPCLSFRTLILWLLQDTNPMGSGPPGL